MTTTWTATDVTNIKTLFNLEYKYVRRIEEALTDFENQYGATAMTDIQGKVNAATVLRSKLDQITMGLAAGKSKEDIVTAADFVNPVEYGIISQSVPNFYSLTRANPEDLISGFQNAYTSLKQSISSEFDLKNIARINTTRIIRA
ncbi:MAG: hypothetical protein ACK5QB_20135 [Pseudanabaena sp.]|jgi:hypothetical protein